MADEKEKKSLGFKFGEYKGEFQKITWPTKKELFKQTVTVIITCIIIAIIIFAMDFSLNWILTQFIDIMGVGW